MTESDDGEQVRRKLSTPALRFRLGVEKRGVPTYKQALHAFCWGCMGGTEDHTLGIREEIRRCSAPSCALYRLRPFR